MEIAGKPKIEGKAAQPAKPEEGLPEEVKPQEPVSIPAEQILRESPEEVFKTNIETLKKAGTSKEEYVRLIDEDISSGLPEQRRQAQILKKELKKFGLTPETFYDKYVAEQPAQKQPWEMTKEELKEWTFKVPEGGASKTPKSIFQFRQDKEKNPGDYETLYDLSQQKDSFRFDESLGKGWKDWKTSLHLKETIKKNKPITIYRVSDFGDIVPGAYVSESLEYVKTHQESIIKGKGEVFSKQVKASELLTYGDPHEFLYMPESIESYHKSIVQQALSEGKPVPAEVLKDYPELQKQKPAEVEKKKVITGESQKLLDQAEKYIKDFDKSKTIRYAEIIAQVEKSKTVEPQHMAEAIQYHGGLDPEISISTLFDYSTKTSPLHERVKELGLEDELADKQFWKSVDHVKSVIADMDESAKKMLRQYISVTGDLTEAATGNKLAVGKSGIKKINEIVDRYTLDKSTDSPETKMALALRKTTSGKEPEIQVGQTVYWKENPNISKKVIEIKGTSFLGRELYETGEKDRWYPIANFTVEPTERTPKAKKQAVKEKPTPKPIIKQAPQVSTEGTPKEVLLRQIDEAIKQSPYGGKISYQPGVERPAEKPKELIEFKAQGATYRIENTDTALKDFKDRVEKGVSLREDAPRGGQGLVLGRVKLSSALGFPEPQKPTDRPQDPIITDLPPHEMPMRLEKPAGAVETTSAPEVIESLSFVVQAFGGKTPIRIGRFKHKALGIFKQKEEVIRVKAANDITTATHEVGHAIEKHVFGWVKGSPWKNPNVNSTIQKELSKLGHILYGETQPAAGYKREGFAEFVRLWVTNRAQAERQAPEMFKWFQNEFLPNYPGGQGALEGASRLARVWQEQGAQLRGRKSVAGEPSLKENLETAVKNLKRFFSVQTHFEMLQPYDVLAREAEKKLGHKLAPSEDPYFTGKALRTTHDARVKYMVEKGMIDIAGNITGAPLQDIRALVKDRRADFTTYLWAKRALALWNDPKNQARNPGLSIKDAEQIVKELDNPNFQLAAQKVYDWNQGVLNYAAEASRSFAAILEKIKEVDPGYYIPLNREFRELDEMWARAAIRGAKGGSPIARLKGSGRRIKDPFPQMISNARNIIRSAHQRMIVDQTIKLSKIEGMGHFVEKVPVEQIPAATRTLEQVIEQINRQLAEQGGGISLEGDIDLAGEAITFFAPAQSPKGKDPIIPIWNNGEVEWYQVDGELYRLLNGLEVYRLPEIMGLPILDWTFGVPTRVFRAGTTGLRATFSLVTNPFRDIQTLWINTQSNVNAFRLLGTWIHSMTSSALDKVGYTKQSPYFEAFQRLGGEMSQSLAQDMNHTRRTARNLFKDRLLRTVDPRNWLDYIREILQFPESASRVTELKLLSDKVGWKPGQPMTLDQSLELLLASKEVTVDFSAGGEFSRLWNQIAPFWNAGFQGPRSFARAAGRDPKKFILHGLGALTIPTLLNWWINKDKDWYTELSPAEKFLYWYFETDWPQKTLVRLPRAFEVGQIFASFPEMFMDSFYRQDAELAKEWFGVFMKNSTPEPTPLLLKEVIQQHANKDFFWDRPIVSRGLIKRPAEEQFDEFTSRLSIKLGDVFNVSPKRVDHGIRSIFGTLSGDILELTGLGESDGIEKEKEAADIPVIGTLFKRGGELGMRQQSINKLYDLYEDATTKQASIRYEETEDERQLRLMLGDATRVMTLTSYVRSRTVKASDREKLTQEALSIAKEVLDIYSEGRITWIRREYFAEKRRKAESAKVRFIEEAA